MKTIIAPTDFTVSGDNAALYAAALAEKMGAKLILFNAYNIPVPSTEIPVYTLPPQELRRDCIEKLRGVKGRIERVFPGIEIELMASPGFPAAEILTYAAKIKASMLVMGLRKRKRRLGELLGSVTTAVLKKAKCETLVVPEGVKYNAPSTILFAYDYNAPLPEEVSEKLKAYVALFKASLLVVDVVHPLKTGSRENAISGVKLENTLAGVEHEAFFPPNENPGEELVSFMKTHPTGWIVMMPHSYSFFERLIHHSLTKEMAFHTEVPLLSIHS